MRKAGDGGEAGRKFNWVSPLLTALAISIPALIWGGTIDARVKSVEADVGTRATRESSRDIQRRIGKLEDADLKSSEQYSAIREALGVISGEQQAQRRLIESFVSQQQRERGR